MASVPTETEVLASAAPLVASGVALHWLRRREKAPIHDDWSTAPVHTFASLKAGYRTGSNLGIRLGEPSKTVAGYVHLIDLDIRDAEQAEDARAALRQLWPEFEKAPFVISGSGGESRHFYFITDKPFRSRKLAKSDGFTMVWDAKKNRDVKKNDWEIEIFGSGKQAVLPPSVHPDTGEPYTWGREMPWGLLVLGVGPHLPSKVIEQWGATEDDMSLEDDTDLLSLIRAQPMGLTEDEIATTLADLPEDWSDDRDMWLQVGAALHHEYQGKVSGLERWNDWSRQSEKFDAEDQKRVWKSFRDSHRKPVRMATLIKAAGEARLNRAHCQLGLDALLGAADEPEPEAESPAMSGLDALLAITGPAAPPPITPGVRGAIEIDPEWKSYLQRNEEGALKPTLPNVQLIVRNDIRSRGIVALNQFTQDIVLIRAPGTKALHKASPKPVRQLDHSLFSPRDATNGDLWADSHDYALRAILEAPERQGGYELKTSDRDLKAAIDMVAQENAFHPVREYLNGLVWDGTLRAASLFVDYVGAPDSPYHREAAQLFLLGAVTRIYEPGHKFDFVPILEGLQGKRKSTFIEILGRRWTAELSGDFHDAKGMVEIMQGAWILEMPELQGFSKAEVTTIKGFISKRKDKVRMAYAKRASEFPRQCVFMGSTNEVEYLRDSSGGRRFWPITCTIDEIPTDRLERDVDQIWAEIVEMYRQWRAAQPYGRLPLYMKNPAAADEARELQESRRQEQVEEVLAGQIISWLDRPINLDMGFDDLEGETPRYRNEVCLLEIWHQMLGNERSRYDARAQQLLGKAMRLVPDWHYARRGETAHYGQQRLFRRNEPL